MSSHYRVMTSEQLVREALSCGHYHSYDQILKTTRIDPEVLKDVLITLYLDGKLKKRIYDVELTARISGSSGDVADHPDRYAWIRLDLQ